MSREPFSQTPDRKVEEARRAAKQLILDYKTLFAGERGKRVMADLQRKFGFGQWAARDTEDSEVIIRRVFMAGPLHHIDLMMKTNFKSRSETKPKKALSKASNEHSEQSDG